MTENHKGSGEIIAVFSISLDAVKLGVPLRERNRIPLMERNGIPNHAVDYPYIPNHVVL